jgi:hypothetical protein
MLGRRQQEEDPETTLARCIVLLDDVRAYRRKDIKQVEAQFAPLKKARFKDIYDMWVKARPSAEKIVDMPLKVPGVRQSISRLAWLGVTNKVFLIFLMLFVALLIVPVWTRPLGPSFLGVNGLLYAAFFLLLVVVSMTVSTVMDYRIRKKIIAYEKSTMDQYAPAREKMKECASRIMTTLAKEVSRSKKDPNDYGLVLYFDDYDNLEVVNKWKPRSMFFFKKSYNHFQVIPKP